MFINAIFTHWTVDSKAVA